jgi:CRISPR-associated endonuclease Csn1
MQLWNVIRWYAHNRGYDGNALWKKGDVEAEIDAKKVQNANALMERYGTHTMCETVCAFLGVSLDNDHPTLRSYFKGSDVAFPRSLVRAEVERVIRAQFTNLRGCDERFLALLVNDLSDREKTQWKLPDRYSGGLLFGQLIPRFDNRIIPYCPITGEKTPLKHSADYYRFRWALLLANLTVESSLGMRRPLTSEERLAIHHVMEQRGRMTPSELKRLVESATGCSAKSLDKQFFSPESEKALLLDPVRAETTSDALSGVWSAIPPRFQRIFAGAWFRSEVATLSDWLQAVRQAGEDVKALQLQCEQAFQQYLKRRGKKSGNESYEAFLRRPLKLTAMSGRAPYCRGVLRKAFEEVLAGLHPAAVAAEQPVTRGEMKDGCLARTIKVLEREGEVALDTKTNNHLVRQRIGMFERLFSELYSQYASGDVRRVGDVTVEVARDMQEYSGKTAKEKAQVFSLKAQPFQRAEGYLSKAFEEAGIRSPITYNMIRKARIAIAQEWTCPYTGRRFTASDIAFDRVDFEHIIPHSQRLSNSLDGLCVTFRQVNAMKGKRTAYSSSVSFKGGRWLLADQMITARFGRRTVIVVSLAVCSRSLNPARGASDEDRIRWRRKQWLLMESTMNATQSLLPVISQSPRTSTSWQPPPHAPS